MLQFRHLFWQDIVVWVILGLVIFALLYYIWRRLQSFKIITKKDPGSCTSCQNCPHSEQSCAKVENHLDSENKE